MAACKAVVTDKEWKTLVDKVVAVVVVGREMLKDLMVCLAALLGGLWKYMYKEKRHLEMRMHQWLPKYFSPP